MLELEQKLPKQVVWAVIAICALPFLLNVAGVDFGSMQLDQGSPEYGSLDAKFYAMRGSFTHTLLEWSAFSVAFFTVLMAFVHFGITRDVTTPVIGVALLCAGCMDAFHTLAADRLIEAVADNRDLIPFTWALARMFSVAIMIVGVSSFWLTKHASHQGGLRLVLGVSLVLATAAYVTIHVCANSVALPNTQFPGALVTRPYDAVPLLLYIGIALPLYSAFHRAHHSVFSHALLISLIPEIVVQLHMAFGSSALFDNHFNIGHFLKIVAYLVPFVGLCSDYLLTYKKLALEVSERELAEIRLLTYSKELEARNRELSESNRELDDFAYVASHDLKEPLRGISNYATFLLEDYGERLDEDGKQKLETLPRLAKRLEILIDSLLHFSRVGRLKLAIQRTDLDHVLNEVLASLQLSIEEREIDVRRPRPFLPVTCDRVRVTEVFRNLVTNAMKYNDKKDKWIEIGWREIAANGDGGDLAKNGHKAEIAYYIQDNGIGIPEKHHDGIFRIFKRLHGRDKFGGGTGAGLTIVQKIVEKHGGKVWVESSPNEGTTFLFTLAPQEVAGDVLPDFGPRSLDRAQSAELEAR